MTPLRIGLLGTRGVPARYGGFETAVEEVGRRLASRGHDVVVYCRGKRAPSDTYLGMRLVHLPSASHRSFETLSHTFLTGFHMQGSKKFDAVIVFNAANAFILPVVSRKAKAVAVHVDGLEWQRAKWGLAGRNWYRTMERLAVRRADVLIADSHGIQDYYRETHGADSRYIAYGSYPIGKDSPEPVETRGLTPGRYHLVVARFEPENNVHIAIEGHRLAGGSWPLAIVGSVPYETQYTAELHALGADSSVRFLGAEWDQHALDQLFAHAGTYLHGHSVGGTNPALLRAMGAAAPIAAYNVKFNEEVTGDTAHYYRTPEDLATLLIEAEADPSGWAAQGKAAQLRAAQLYDWDAVTDDYEELARDLSKGRRALAHTKRKGPTS